jgi:hypothetical protein
MKFPGNFATFVKFFIFHQKKIMKNCVRRTASKQRDCAITATMMKFFRRKERREVREGRTTSSTCEGLESLPRDMVVIIFHMLLVEIEVREDLSQKKRYGHVCNLVSDSDHFIIITEYQDDSLFCLHFVVQLQDMFSCQS